MRDFDVLRIHMYSTHFEPFISLQLLTIHMISKHIKISHKQSVLFYGTLISVTSVNNGPCCSVTCFNVMIPSTVGETLYIELQGNFLSSVTYRCWIENFDGIQSLRWFSFRLRWILEETWSDYRAKVTKHFLSLWLQSNDNDALASNKRVVASIQVMLS